MGGSRNKTHRLRRQRGTVYVLVLSITSLLVVLGIASSMLARKHTRQSVLQHNQTSARLAAITALDYQHKMIDGDATWRNAVTDGVWSAGATYEDAVVQYKFIDEMDGSLVDSSAHPFRLYAKATVGDAVRIYSAEFIPDAANSYTRDPRTFRQELAD